ncbi:MAG TPA: lipopolysaccharide heptosyltransferase II [Victivallales bacterium]|nr:lipopolysaccharide heptosyltransferase II [Victivallales bacterium]HPO90274.1 lipopolysaccharide heptosyltransferase II [Victivallales bacterium]HRU01493.1 lipopolysaccharide heptosyltransferase II [Victivallales bacterium]
MKILIRCPNWVGDIVMATPVFRCVKENFPKAKVTALVRKYALGVIESSPHFDTIIIAEDKSFYELFKLAIKLRKESFDLAILLTNSPRAFLPIYFAGIKKIIAYRRNIQKFFVDGPVPLKENGKIKAIPMTDYYVELCRFMGLKIPNPLETELFVSEEDEKEIDLLFEKSGISNKEKIICLNPGAKFGSSKCWTPANFAKLADLVSAEFSARIILVSGPGEEKIASEILSLSNTEIIHFGNLNLSRLKALIKRVSILVTNDTGPRHYATAFKVPAVVILGPTNPAYTEYGLEITSFVKAEVKCSPCHLRICPRNHECMKMISPELLMEYLRKYLKS